MYLKILTQNDGEGKRDWKVFGGIRHMNYSSKNSWTWEEYASWRDNVDYWVGPLHQKEWAQVSTNNGYREFARAHIYFNDGGYMSCIWDTVAYLLGDDGKTIEVITASG